MNAELLKSVVGVCYVGIFLERGFPGMWMLDGNCRIIVVGILLLVSVII